MKPSLVTFVLAALGTVGAGCVENADRPLPALDVPYYRCNVQPIVDAKCSMLACHGDVRRPFHSFTRNRMRLVGSNENRNLPLSEQELDLNLKSALGFVDEEVPARSFLLLKPLDADGGGYFHRGKEIFVGGDVYASVDDPEYQVLLTWVTGGTADPNCVYPGAEANP